MSSPKRAAVVLLMLAFSSCNLDSGGGSGDGVFKFAQGYAFIRDREVFAADKSDYQGGKKLGVSGSNSEPAISADGRVVVFVHTDDTTGKTSLRKVPASGGAESELVPASANRQVSQPAISGNGSLVVFISTSTTVSTVSTVRIDGTAEAAVPQSTKDASPTFFPDGKSVLCFTGPDSLAHDQLTALELLSGTRTVKLSSLASTGSRAVLSPDGASVAFEEKVSGKYKIFVAPIAGGTPAQITATDGDDRFPTWVSSARLGFTSNSGGQDNVYELDVASAKGSAKLTVPVASQGAFGGK